MSPSELREREIAGEINMLRLVLDEDKKISRTRMIERKELQQKRFTGFSKSLLFDDTAKNLIQ